MKQQEFQDEIGVGPSARRRLHDDDSIAAQPPAELDRAVIAQAQRALEEPPPKARPAVWIARWTIPIGVAATILLSSMIVLQMAPIVPAPMPTSAPTAAPAATPAADEGNAMQAAPAESDARLRSAAPGRDQSATRQRAEEQSARTPAPPLAPPPPPAPAAFAKSGGRTAGNLSAPATPARESNAEPAATADALAVGAGSAAAGDAPKDAATDALRADPARWLLEIARLEREGREDEARRERLAFKERYPDYRETDGQAARP